MDGIMIVTVGDMNMYFPNGHERGESFMQLYCYRESGAVLVTHSGGKDAKQIFPPDSEALAEAVSQIVSLLAEQPHYSCDSRPHLNEVYLGDGKYQYAPREALSGILESLREHQAEQELRQEQTPPPNPAGLVQMMPPPKRELRSARLENEDMKYRLDVNGDSVKLYLTFNGEIYDYRFSASHPAYEQAAKELTALLLAIPEASDGVHEVRFSDDTVFQANPERILEILDTLQSGLEAECENVEIRHINQNLGTTMAGAVAYRPQMELMQGMLCGNGMQMMNQNFRAAAPEKKEPPAKPRFFTVVRPDGTWDCACGTKALTSKFCINCGNAKPLPWKCAGCGAENTGKFCTDCGKPRPQV